jgi:DNA-directed RNA polymerase subunit RPC12/RpoP
MKFLCVACDEAMRLASTAGPDEGSLTVTFACPKCGHRVAMLTNPWETQMVRSLGVKVGGQAAHTIPFASVRGSLARQREAVFVETPSEAAGTSSSATEPSAAAPGEGPGCPFAAMMPGDGSATPGEGPAWTPEAEARLHRIPAFVQPMAKQTIERFARDRGYGTITGSVMDEARDFIGM